MKRTKLVFYCQDCASESPKWLGRCPDCHAWNTFVEHAVEKSDKQRGYAGEKSLLLPLSAVPITGYMRIATSLKELNRVLGGGLVAGSVVLIGGDPGIGKSTLLLQTLCQIPKAIKALYVTGEESLQQVSMRANRLQLASDDLLLLSETRVEQIMAVAQRETSKIMVVDSIQTILSEPLSSAPGSVSQVREATAQLVRYAKQTDTIILLVGHVTKEGALAGPRVLEHMVDTVLYFEGDTGSRFRIIRAIKNRFGAVNELGVFAMTDQGLREVSNPSAIFLSNHQQGVNGSAIVALWEGTRPVLVEMQALVDQSHSDHPRRVTVGFEYNRLNMLLAVLHRHAQIQTHHQDVFINVVGGGKISETGVDLALILAIVSSLNNRPLPSNLVAFGEIGLAGEIRPVPSGQERLREARKHGLKRAIIPKANASSNASSDFDIFAASTLKEAIESIAQG